MRLPTDEFFHLTYCTNIHPADGWDAVFANLARYAPAVKARVSPAAPFGIGLRLSAREARELRAGTRLAEFRAFLDQHGLYVAVINGFPYGPFHSTVVKANVYAPDWRDEARVAYTEDLIEILAALVPPGLDGGISTAPLSYKRWMAADDAAAWTQVAENVARVAETLVRLRERHGVSLHLDVEPEPDCSLETTDDTLWFFTHVLLEDGAARLAALLGVPLDHARDHLLEHVAVCFDCCHFAVEFEDPAAALTRLTDAGIRIGRVQLSSALSAELPDDRAFERLAAFADATYLHQVVERRGAVLDRYPDLDVALRRPRDAEPREWRVHFHVPLFAASYDTLQSTQREVRRAIEHVLAERLTRHLEIETYTWDVLPPGLKLDLEDSIVREYEWVLGVVRSVRL